MRLFALLFLLMCVIGGCKPAKNLPETALVLQHDTDIHLQLIPATAPVETPLKLMITAANVSAISGELKGVSMYMGRIPLHFQQQDAFWQADFLLGACSDPAMTWQVELELQFADGEKRIIKQQFQSSWR
jgi:hypothetical protein